MDRFGEDFTEKKDLQQWWYGKGTRDPPEKAKDRIVDREGMCLKIRESDLILPDGMNNRKTRRRRDGTDDWFDSGFSLENDDSVY